MSNLSQAVAAKAQASLGAAGFFFEQLDLSKSKFTTTTITASSFSALSTSPTEQTIIYVDGGNNTLIDSPSLHVSALKVAIITQTNTQHRAKFAVETHDASVIISLEKVNEKKKLLYIYIKQKQEKKKLLIIIIYLKKKTIN